jgi:hypothetical protein
MEVTWIMVHDNSLDLRTTVNVSCLLSKVTGGGKEFWCLFCSCAAQWPFLECPSLNHMGKETAMLLHELLSDEGILLVRPQGPIQADDFEEVAKMVDPYIERNGKLRGVMVEAPSFPGWDTFAALLSHLRFVRDHHRLIGKVAIVSDSGVLSVAPQIAKHFVKAEVRHFNANDRDSALAWLRE